MYLSGNKIVAKEGYSPFGTVTYGRDFNFSSVHKYGFNGQEKDEEVYGKGNANTATFWEYDTRLGRRWNRDPIYNPSLSDYSTFANNPILFSDINGDTLSISLFNYIPLSKQSFVHKMEDTYYPFFGYMERNYGTAFVKTAETYIKKQVNDNVYAIFGHGSPYGIEVMHPDGTITDYDNHPKEFIEYLESVNPELQKAIKNKNPITLVLYSCQTGSNISIQESTKIKINLTESFAQQIAKHFPNITVVAPTGNVTYGNNKDGKPDILGVDNVNGPAQWNTIQHGTGKIVHSSPANVKTGKEPKTKTAPKQSHMNQRYL